MKRYFIIAAAALVALASCTKVESVKVQKEVSFKAINYKNTKAAINATRYPTNLPFGVFAYYLGEGKTWAADGATSDVFMDDVKCSYAPAYATQNYAPDNKYFWPFVGSVTFIAYSPYDETNVAATYAQSTKTLTVTDFALSTTIANQQDLMYSKAGDAADKTENEVTYNGGTDKGVKIQFRHALSQIRFFAKYDTSIDPATTKFQVNTITLKKVVNKGTMTVVNDATPVWANGSTTADFVALAEDTDVPATYAQFGDNVLVLPQTLADDLVVEVKYTMFNAADLNLGSKTVNVQLNQTNGIEAFEPNKIYNIKLNITAEVIRFSPEIVDWDETEIDEEYNIPSGIVTE